MGNTFTCCFDKNNNNAPRICIGPHWYLAIVSNILISLLVFSMYQAFYIIWFFSDLKDDKTKLLSISDKMLYSKVWAFSQGINANKKYMEVEESDEESKEVSEDNQKYL